MSTTPKQRAEVIHRLGQIGVGFHDAEALRRCAMTLSNWNEQECGNGNETMSWSIERDETTGKPFRCFYPHDGKPTRTPIADREKGALVRAKATLEKYPELMFYHQGDCRGASLYVLRKADVNGCDVSSVYNHGVAVY